MWLQEKIQSSKLSCSNIRKKAKKTMIQENHAVLSPQIF